VTAFFFSLCKICHFNIVFTLFNRLTFIAPHPGPRRATWGLAALMLLCWLSSNTTVWGGCFLDEDYRRYHHGNFFQLKPDSLLKDESSPSTARSLGTWPAAVWIYENGSFQPLKDPLPPRCDSPGCRSNPMDHQMGQPHSIAVEGRTLAGTRSQPFVIEQRENILAFSNSYVEAPRGGESLFIDRPPKGNSAR
jgi:hypothetical protein